MIDLILVLVLFIVTFALTFLLHYLDLIHYHLENYLKIKLFQHEMNYFYIIKIDQQLNYLLDCFMNYYLFYK